jgi:eukaryotic-like serine/threonine-protein kinase
MANVTGHTHSGYLLPGTQLNGMFEIDAPVAAGGMGEVYRGHSIQTHDAVAIKVIKADFAEHETAMALFRKEASALHNLQNEAIVRYYTFAVDPALQRAYLAMEFVEGESLSDIAKRGPLPVADVLLLARRLALGLHAAHQRGIIHRDVSPDNIILPDNDVRQAKIIDFGIARSTRKQDGTVIGGGFAGKHNYVSPEQLGLFGAEVTPKSDMYSLALVLVEALRGSPLDMGGSQVEVIDKRRVVPNLAFIDARIRPLIERMLQPDPIDRFASMLQVAEWVDAPPPVATRTPSVPPAAAERTVIRTVPPRRVGPKPRPESDGKSHMGLVAAVIVLVLLGGGGVGYFALGTDFFRPKPTEQKKIVTLDPSKETPIAPVTPPVLDEKKPDETHKADGAASGAADSGKTADGQTQTAGDDRPKGPNDAGPGGTIDTGGATASGTSGGGAVTGSQKSDKLAKNDSGAPQPPAGGWTVDTKDTIPVVARDLDAMARLIQEKGSGECFASVPVRLAQNTALIESYAVKEQPFNDLLDSFKKAQNFEPDIEGWILTPPQCPFATFMAKAKIDKAQAVKLDLGALNLKSGQYLTGTVEQARERLVDVLYLSDDGFVESLSSIVRAAGGRAFNLKVERAAPGGGAKLQLVIAVTAPVQIAALRTAKAMAAERFFTALATEVTQKNVTLGVSIRGFNLD